MAERLILVCEGPHDHAVAEALVERILREKIEWYDGNQDQLRCWEVPLRWREIKEKFHSTGINMRGLPQDHGDGIAADKAIKFIDFKYNFDNKGIIHILFLRDCDGQKERYTALKNIQEKYPNRSIIIGFAIDRIEAWILAAFIPNGEKEEAALENEKKNLGFDPTYKPHELTASHEGAKTNPKRVLDVLMTERGNNRDVYAEMMKEVRWEHLEERGNKCGIMLFCKEIQKKLIPHFDF